MPKRRKAATRKKPRLRSEVCKPCWELKYCPYGPLVEQFPLNPDGGLTHIQRLHKWVKGELSSSRRKTEREYHDLVERFLFSNPPDWEWVSQYQTKELSCNVFGHVCPVFFVAEPFTETKVGRKVGRTIPRDVMLQVVRRDGQICQRCNKPVPDKEVEFDHVIPFARGGPMTAENLRLVHRACNRQKGASLNELLWKREKQANEGERPGRSLTK